MKRAFVILYSFLGLVASGQDESRIRLSTSWIDEQERERLSKGVIETYSEVLRQIREELSSSMATQETDLQLVVKPALQALNAITERRDVGTVGELLPFLDWLHKHQDRPVTKAFENSAIQGTLNYVVEGIFNVEMRGHPDAVDEHRMETMIRFYAGNPAQTSETSWRGNDHMLFVFGDRVLNTLATKVPDRIDAFYKAVLDARKSAQSGPGPDEEPIPDAERPTAEQLRDYEAAFSRLEILATKGVLPISDPSADRNTASRQVPSHVQLPPPKKPTDQQQVSSKPVEESPPPPRWPLVAGGIAAALALLWVLLMKRARFRHP